METLIIGILMQITVTALGLFIRLDKIRDAIKEQTEEIRKQNSNS